MPPYKMEGSNMIHYTANHPEMGNMLWLEEGDIQIGIALDFGIRVRHLSI